LATDPLELGWVGDDSHIAFGEKFPGKKQKCGTVHFLDATASSFAAKVLGEVLAHFQAVT
jgi:hypothetical protein